MKDKMTDAMSAKMMGKMMGKMKDKMMSEYKVGQKVKVKPGKEHEGMEEKKVGTIKEISTQALGIKFDGDEEVHHWYTDAEVESAL